MRTTIGLLTIILIIVAAAPLAPSEAALYWSRGVHDKDISVCFVGDAVTSRPDRVQQILNDIEEFESVANIEFDYLGKCPAPTRQDGEDYYDGDIRVLIPNIIIPWTTGPVPGLGCPVASQVGGSWSAVPADLEQGRACLYNLKFGDDPWDDTPYRNHTLHEFGHSLGLRHEHERKDATCYDPENDTRRVGSGYLTPYDKASVMHYRFEKPKGHTCDVNGNYDRTGLSEWDKLALRILYPEDVDDHEETSFSGHAPRPS